MDETKLTKQDKQELIDSAKELQILVVEEIITFLQELIIKIKDA